MHSLPRRVVLNLKLRIANYLYLMVILVAAYPAIAQSPQIKTVSVISTQQLQTITIAGSGFGTQASYTGDSDFISLLDTTKSWQAGYEGCLLGFCTTDTVTLIVQQWTDTKITLGGFSGAWGTNGFTLSLGDNEQISVFNPQTSAGPATANITVGAVPTTTKLTSAPNPSNAGEAVQFTAMVNSSAGPPPNGETVTFMQGSMTLGNGKLASGKATLKTSKLAKGTHAITAVYAGDSNFDASQSNTVKQVVQ